MAQVSDNRLTKLNFVGGVDNRSHETKVGTGFARWADNVDIDIDGVVTVRDGYSLLSSLPGAHSVWADDLFPYGLVADSSKLYRLDPDGATTVLASGLAGADVYYALLGNRVYWSNGVQNGALSLSNATLPLGVQPLSWGVETPLPSFVVSATTVGGLHAGRYGVTATHANRLHEEGGAPEPVYVDVAEGGGISVSRFSAPLTSVPSELRVYRTEANAPDFLYAQSVAPGTTALSLGAQQLGRVLTTLFKDAFPPATMLLSKAGRIFGAMGNTLVWTDALYYGLTTPSTNFIPFPDEITMVAAPESARFMMYVGTTQKVYLLAGESIDTVTSTVISSHGVIPGSMAMVPPEVINEDNITAPVPFWIGAEGVPYAGTEHGVMQLHKVFAYPQYEKASAAFIQTEGHSRYIVSGRGGRQSGLTATDSFVATVYNNGGGN